MYTIITILNDELFSSPSPHLPIFPNPPVVTVQLEDQQFFDQVDQT
jgi:hypothetical protein